MQWLSLLKYIRTGTTHPTATFSRPRTLARCGPSELAIELELCSVIHFVQSNKENPSSPLWRGGIFLAQLINVLLQDTIRCCPSSRNPISEVSSPSQVFSFWAPHHQNTPLSQSVKSTPPRFNGRFPSHPHLRHRWGKNSVFSSGCSWWALDCYSTKVFSFKMTPHVCTRTCAPSRTCGIVQNKIVQLVKETFLIPFATLTPIVRIMKNHFQ